MRADLIEITELSFPERDPHKCTKMVQCEGGLFSVVSILLLILLLRPARRMCSLITYLGFKYEVSEDVLATGSLITHRRRTLRDERHCEGKHGFTLDPKNGLKKCTETETSSHCRNSISG